MRGSHSPGPLCCLRCPQSSVSPQKVGDPRPDLETQGLAPRRGSAPLLPGLRGAPDRCVSNCASRNRRIRIRARLACRGVRARGSASKEEAAGPRADREGAEGPHHSLFGRPARAGQRAAPRDARSRNSPKFAKPQPKSLESCSSLSGRLAWPSGAGDACGDVPAGREGKGAPRPGTCPYLPSGSPPGSERTGVPLGGDRPPKAERAALWGRGILAPSGEGAEYSPGRRKRRGQRPVLGVGSPQQERRGHYSPQAAAPSERSRRRPLRSYTAMTTPPPPPPPSQAFPPGGARGGVGRSQRPRDPSAWALTARAGQKVPPDWLLG